MQKKWAHSEVLLQLQARSLKTQTRSIKMETQVKNGEHVISNAKDQLKHVSLHQL